MIHIDKAIEGLVRNLEVKKGGIETYKMEQQITLEARSKDNLQLVQLPEDTMNEEETTGMEGCWEY